MLYRFISSLFCSKAITCAVLFLYTGAVQAHDGGQAAIQVKANPPVSLYQAVMITVALAYGCYLLWRAKRKSRVGENVEENRP
jgi:hypothetical protein